MTDYIGSDEGGYKTLRHTPRNWKKTMAPVLKKRLEITGWNDASTVRPSPEAMFRSVQAWVEENGGIVHPSLIYASENETESGVSGLVVKSDCKAGEILYKIPDKLWLTSSMVRAAKPAALKEVYIRRSSICSEILSVDRDAD